MSHSDDLFSHLPCSLTPNPFFFALFLSPVIFSPHPYSAERHGTKAINAKCSQISSLRTTTAQTPVMHTPLIEACPFTGICFHFFPSSYLLSLLYLNKQERRGPEHMGRGDGRKRTCWKHDGGSNSPVLMPHSCANLL